MATNWLTPRYKSTHVLLKKCFEVLQLCSVCNLVFVVLGHRRALEVETNIERLKESPPHTHPLCFKPSWSDTAASTPPLGCPVQLPSPPPRAQRTLGMISISVNKIVFYRLMVSETMKAVSQCLVFFLCLFLINYWINWLGPHARMPLSLVRKSVDGDWITSQSSLNAVTSHMSWTVTAGHICKGQWNVPSYKMWNWTHFVRHIAPLPSTVTWRLC